MTDPRDLVVAIDGGNSKTDVLLVDAAGTVLGSSHGPGVSPQNVGVAPCVEALDGLVLQALEAAGRPASRPFAVHTAAYLANTSDMPGSTPIPTSASRPALSHSSCRDSWRSPSSSPGSS